jgi:plasmid maintenance system antidote protein VapI
MAKALSVSIPTVNEIVRERRAVTAAMALRLSRYSGTTPQHWQSLQAEYDLGRARPKMGKAATKKTKPLSRRDQQIVRASRGHPKLRRIF